MKIPKFTSVLRFVAILAVVLAVTLPFPAELSAHGRGFAGPGGRVVPPAPGGPTGAGPKTARPDAPRGPGPATGGGAGPGSGSASVAGSTVAAGPASSASSPGTPRGGIELAPDLTRWEFWWEFNKDPFIRLKDAIHSEPVTSGSDEFFMGISGRRRAGDSLKPTAAQITNEVLPALRAALELSDQRDIVSSVLLAMAKIGRDHPDFEILPLMAERLTSGDQEVREIAALSIGISQMVSGVDSYLVDLAADNEAGRKLVGRGTVDYRTRSFAAYGLGLVAQATKSVPVKSKCLEVLSGILGDDTIVGRDVRVAAINSIGLLVTDPNANYPPARQLLSDCLSTLESYFMQAAGAGDQIIQSHVPIAIAKLLGRDGPADLLRHYKDLFLAELQGRGPVKRSSHDIYRSSALALGVLARPNDGRADHPDQPYSEALLSYYRNGKDRQARYFALMALAQIGGSENRNHLLEAFRRSNHLERPWAALALGVLAHHTYGAAVESMGDADVDQRIGETLREALKENANPDTRSALAIALGLCRYVDAADELRDMLIEYRHQDALAGYLCIGLALMNDRRSTQDITDIVTSSVRRPWLLSQSAIALGKLGDKDVTELLQAMLVEGEPTMAKTSAIASALGSIGDWRTIRPLIEILFDGDLTDLTRSYAAVAIGGVVDKEPLPWNSKIAVDINYRALVETLTSGASGILDIL